jgi:uncharacterized lipoprotein YajG
MPNLTLKLKGNTMKNSCLIILVLLLTGCVAGQEIALHYNPVPPILGYEGHGMAVSVSVVDNRPYIKGHDKDPSYLGHYRASFGNTWDVTNFNAMPLADQMAIDLSHELQSLGFTVVGQGPGKNILVTINDFNFDAMWNGEIWYGVNIKIKENGKNISQSEVKDTAFISGNAMVGAKYDMEREIPVYYDQIIRGLIRANPGTMAALKKP